MFVPRRLSIPILALVFLAFVPLLRPGSASAHAGLLRADPAANSAVPQAPARVRLWFSEPIEPRFSGIEVYDTSRNQVDAGDFRIEGTDRKSASVGLSSLPDGTYTVSWHNLSTVDGHSLAGSFAFSMGDAVPPVGAAAVATGAGTQGGAPVVPSTLVRVLNFLGMALLFGAFGFRSLVLAPAVGAYRRSPARELVPVAGGARMDGPLASPADASACLEGAMVPRVLSLARIALGLLLLGSIASLALQAVVASRLSIPDALGRPLIDLLSTRYGVVWFVRMGLIAALVGLLWAPRVRWNGGWSWAAGLLLAAAVLLTTSLVSHSAASGQPEMPAWVPVAPALGGHALHAVLIVGGTVVWFISIRPDPRRWWVGLAGVALAFAVLFLTSLPVAMDWLHLVATSLWIGGLVQLLLVTPRGLAVLEPSEGGAFLRALIPGFSRLALPAVAVLALTGVYSAWFQVREVAALTGTPYGLSLLAKTILFLPLVALGAANLYLGSERLRRLTRRFRRGASPAVSRRFFQAVRAEVLLVGLVLLATGVLTSLSPPAQTTSAAPAVAFSETVETEDGRITLSADPAVAGQNTIDVRLTDGDRPVTDASKVAVRFSLESEGIAESESVARPAGDGYYRFVGPQLSVPGTWKVEIVARRPGHDDARAVFSVPVAAPRVAEADGVRAELRVTPTRPVAGEGTELELVVTDTSGKPLPRTTVQVTLLMPAHAHYEDVVLQDLGSGRSVTYAQLRMAGEWVVQVVVERQGRPLVDLNIKLDVAE